MLESDLRYHMESSFKLKAYPFTIPSSATLPAITYRGITDIRDSDSNLKSANIRSVTIQITIVSKNAGDTLKYKESIIDAYEDFAGSLVSDSPTVSIMIARVMQSIPLYDSGQKTYEYNVDVSFKYTKL